MIGPGFKRTHHVAVGVKKVKPWRTAHAMADVPGRHGHHSIAYSGPVVIILGPSATSDHTFNSAFVATPSRIVDTPETVFVVLMSAAPALIFAPNTSGPASPGVALTE